MIPQHHEPPGSQGLSPLETAATISSARSMTMFGERPIRTILIDGAPWLVARDLCRALDLPIDGRTTSAKYVSRIPQAHRGYTPLPTRSGLQRCAIISAEGALLLSKRRDRRVDRRMRAFLNREVLKRPSAAAAVPIINTNRQD